MRWCGVKSQLESHSVSNKTSCEKKAFLCVSAAAHQYSTGIFWTLLGLEQTEVISFLKIPVSIVIAICVQNSVSD